MQVDIGLSLGDYALFAVPGRVLYDGFFGSGFSCGSGFIERVLGF